MTIKAIETRYNGYLFRSRLEARWAVFFNALGIKYEYEAEGYVTSDGTCYLPDFFLPSLGTHVEIKPFDHAAVCPDLKKMINFALDGDCHLLLVLGTPGDDHMFLINRRTTPPFAEFEVDQPDIQKVYRDCMTRLMETGYVCLARLPLACRWDLVYRRPDPPPVSELEYAVQQAKSARFEHGQSGPQ